MAVSIHMETLGQASPQTHTTQTSLTHKRNLPGRRALVIGTGPLAHALVQHLQHTKKRRYNLLGTLGEVTGEPPLPILGSLEDIETLIVQHKIKELFFADPEIEAEEVYNWILHLDAHQLVVWSLTDAFHAFEQTTWPLHHGRIEGRLLLRFGTARPSWFYRTCHRTFDIVVSLTILLMTAPMWLWWALRVRQDSKGPIFFWQHRIGRHGKPFPIYKFRTMHIDANPYADAPVQRTDPRVTRYGSWLRRSSIDELPQLYNVLRGEMSLVGPRPIMPFLTENYTPWQAHRDKIRPGMTGLWQILGRKILPLMDNLHYDFFYVRNQSFVLDLYIFLYTFQVVLTGKGAM